MSAFDDKFCEEVYNKLKERINAAIYIRNNANDKRLTVKITKKGLIYEVYYKYDESKKTDDIVRTIVHEYKKFINVFSSMIFEVNYDV